jgi:hypothetical protein
MEERMRKTKAVLFSIWLVSVVCCCVLLPSRAQSQGGTATLTVGDGAGTPGSQGNQITVSLTNDVPVGGIQLEICDEDDFMVCSGCQGVDRASSFLCSLNELPDGCCKMILVDVTGGGVAEGSGPIFTIDYDVSADAPGGACSELTPEDTIVIQDGPDMYSVDTQSVAGEFCFSSGCIAEQLYGNHSRVTEFLRKYRDTVLRQTPGGRKIIALYYQWSPVLVKAMQQDKDVEANIRKMIDGFLMLVP